MHKSAKWQCSIIYHLMFQILIRPSHDPVTKAFQSSVWQMQDIESLWALSNQNYVFPLFFSKTLMDLSQQATTISYLLGRYVRQLAFINQFLLSIGILTRWWIVSPLRSHVSRSPLLLVETKLFYDREVSVSIEPWWSQKSLRRVKLYVYHRRILKSSPPLMIAFQSWVFERHRTAYPWETMLFLISLVWRSHIFMLPSWLPLTKRAPFFKDTMDVTVFRWPFSVATHNPPSFRFHTLILLSQPQLPLAINSQTGFTRMQHVTE